MNNRVELLGFYGSDLTHALSAWTSTGRELTDERRGRLPALLARLAADGHHTPFEKSALHFLVRCDVASHIHLIKHRIGVSINAESARYKELQEATFYIPEDWPENLQKRLQWACEGQDFWYHDTIRALEAAGMDRKRAKESARFFMPYATQTTMDVQFNFRSFMHFLKLRMDMHAQYEIRMIAAEMLGAVIETHAFDASLEAFGYHVGEAKRDEAENSARPA